MKRWVSGFLALSVLALVISTGIFAMSKAYVAPFNSYAQPVAYANPSLSISTDNSVASTESNDLISFSPKLQFSFASWNIVSSDSKYAKQAYQVVSSELSKYSADQLTKFGLKKVYLVKDLYVDGQFRSGMPEARFEDALYFDIDTKYFSSEGGEYIKRTIHHELRHLADYNLYNNYRPQDNNWLGCNLKGTVYGNGGSSMYSDPSFAHKQHPSTGFISGYATSGIDEDRAEVFGYYMTDRVHLYKTAQNDASLSCKIAQTEALFL